MCTVTLIPQEKNNFILTSNRDEAPNRLPFAPDFYVEKGVKLLFPKDRTAGGTWIGISDKSRLICLLNGGFYIHKRKLPYRQSRGLVVKELLCYDDIDLGLSTYSLENIEPFTAIIVDWLGSLKMIELVWTGTKKHIKVLNDEPKVWSSSTLYTKAMQSERESWFKDFKQHNVLDKSTILNFHKSKIENKNYGFLMDRGFVKTTSITQVTKNENDVKMKYYNLQSNIKTEKTFEFFQSVNE